MILFSLSLWSQALLIKVKSLIRAYSQLAFTNTACFKLFTTFIKAINADNTDDDDNDDYGKKEEELRLLRSFKTHNVSDSFCRAFSINWFHAIQTLSSTPPPRSEPVAALHQGAPSHMT